jgi:hypothetical protein
MSWTSGTAPQSKKLRTISMATFKVSTEEPFCDIGNKETLHNPGQGFVIIIMTYKRSVRLQKMLNAVGRSLENLLVASESNIVVAQSADLNDPKSVSEVKRIVSEVSSSSIFSSITHIETPLLLTDTSFSNGKKLYGSKRNALRNLKSGLAGALDRFPLTQDVVIIEDDARMSCDAFSMYQAMRNSWKSHDTRNIAGGSLHALFRPSLLVGHNDELLGEFFYPSNPRRINLMEVQPRTVIKTFNYILRRATAEKFKQYLGVVDASKALEEGAGNSKETGKSVESPFSSKNEKLFNYEDCNFCEPYCYDHVLEWMLQGNKIFVPDIPRVTQLPGKGMTYAENPVTSIFQGFLQPRNGQDRHSSWPAAADFFSTSKKYRLTTMFPTIGSSSLTKVRPAYSLFVQLTWLHRIPLMLPFIVVLCFSLLRCRDTSDKSTCSCLRRASSRLKKS